MPETVHYGGATHVGLTSVQTSGVNMADNLYNLNAPVSNYNQSNISPAFLSIANADLTVGGTLTAGQTTVSGGFSTKTFIVSDSLQVSKLLTTLPLESSGRVYTGACVDSSNLYVVTNQLPHDPGDTKLYQINAVTGAILNSVSLDQHLSSSTVIGVGRNLYVGNATLGQSANVVIYSPATLSISGNLSSYSFQNQSGIVTDPAGTIYISESATNKIIKYASDSDTNPSTITVSFPAQALAIDTLLYLYASDGNFTIYKLSQSGVILTTFRASAYAIKGLAQDQIAMDSYFNLYVTDSQLNKIHVFSSDGSYAYDIPGDTGFDIATICTNQANDLYTLHHLGRVTKSKIVGQNSDRVYMNSDVVRSVDIQSTNTLTVDTITFSNSFILTGTTSTPGIVSYGQLFTSLASTTFLTPDGTKLLVGQAQLFNQELPALSVNVYSARDGTFLFSLDPPDTQRIGFGWSICSNADGSVFAVGSPVDGHVYIYNYIGERQTSLSFSHGGGWCISMDFSGTKLLVGNSDGGGGQGWVTPALHYLILTGEGWISQSITQVFGGYSIDSVAVSGDGNVLVAGSSVYGNRAGAVGISYDHGSTWSQVLGTNANDLLGYCVSTTYTGDVVLAGATTYIMVTGWQTIALPDQYILASCSISANNYTVTYGSNPTGTGAGGPGVLTYIYNIQEKIPVTYSLPMPANQLSGFGLSLNESGGFFSCASRSAASYPYPTPGPIWTGGLNTGIAPPQNFVIDYITSSTQSYTSKTQSVTYSRTNLTTGPLNLETTQATLDGVYTFQVSDSDLVLSTPAPESAPFAMSILNRLEWSGIGTSTTTSPYFHLEFVNNIPDQANPPYGAGVGFFADPTLTLSQPFIIWPHTSRSFDTTHGDIQSGYQTLGIAIDTGFLGTGYVGIYGNPYPEYPLDVGGDTRVQGDLHLGGNVINTQGILTGINYSIFLELYHSYIGVNGTGVVLHLPQSSTIFAGKQYIIKDESGTASPSNPITIQGNALIDGASSLQIQTGYASVTILWTGSVWSII
jgi:hypothetical protein